MNVQNDKYQKHEAYIRNFFVSKEHKEQARLEFEEYEDSKKDLMPVSQSDGNPS